MQLAVAIESTVDGDLSDFIVDLNQDYREVKQSATNNSARRGGQKTKKKEKIKKRRREKKKNAYTPDWGLNAYLCAIKWRNRVLHIARKHRDSPVSFQLRPIFPRKIPADIASIDLLHFSHGMLFAFLFENEKRRRI